MPLEIARHTEKIEEAWGRACTHQVTSVGHGDDGSVRTGEFNMCVDLTLAKTTIVFREDMITKHRIAGLVGGGHESITEVRLLLNRGEASLL